MLIDCDSCTARPHACGDCIVTHLLQVGPVRGRAEDDRTGPWETSAAPVRPSRPVTVTSHDRVGGAAGPTDLARTAAGPTGPGTAAGSTAPELTDSEVAAVAVLSAGGLVPPLRLVTPSRPAPAPTSDGGATGRTGRRGTRRRTG